MMRTPQDDLELLNRLLSISVGLTGPLRGGPLRGPYASRAKLDRDEQLDHDEDQRGDYR